MKRLSGLDSAFLYLETQKTPMHIGGVAIVESTTPDGPFTLEKLRDMISSRLSASRTLSEKLIDVPLGLGRPYWIQDEAFDIENHIERTQLPEPGGYRELAALVSWQIAEMLPRDRPLWHLLMVEGLDQVPNIPPGSVAIISRVHHAAVDGMSGTEIMRALYDATPVPATLPELPAPEAPPKPSALSLLTGKAAPEAETKGLGSLVKDALEGVVRSGATWAFKRVEPPPFPFTAPRSVFNARVPRERTWDCAHLSLDRIKKIRQATGATVNDVVLAVCGGALRQYLNEQGELPDDPLVAMVPISIRPDEQKKAMGNQVSAMLVSLATDVDTPSERFEKVRTSAQHSKLYNRAVGARTLTDASDIVPFSVAGLATRLYTRMHLAERHRPVFNLVVTNVPGPQIPLYVAGAKLIANVGIGPIFDGMGLIVPVFSYNGRISISFCSAPTLLEDPARLAELIEPALEELEEALLDGEPGAGGKALAE
ncbi:MAG: wax ester/triacylglycerol synthase family O-acyltransferase [Acidobacteriota bacterium]